MTNEVIAVGILVIVCAIISYISYRGYIQFDNDYDDTHV